MSRIAPAPIVRLLAAVGDGPESPVPLSIVTVTGKPIVRSCHFSGAKLSLHIAGLLQLPLTSDCHADVWVGLGGAGGGGGCPPGSFPPGSFPPGFGVGGGL